MSDLLALGIIGGSVAAGGVGWMLFHYTKHWFLGLSLGISGVGGIVWLLAPLF